MLPPAKRLTFSLWLFLFVFSVDCAKFCEEYAYRDVTEKEEFNCRDEIHCVGGSCKPKVVSSCECGCSKGCGFFKKCCGHRESRHICEERYVTRREMYCVQWTYFDIESITPGIGYLSGGTLIDVVGSGLEVHDGRGPYCRFGEVGEVEATNVTATMMQCTSPPSASSVPVPFSISFRRQLEHTTKPISFRYYGDVSPHHSTVTGDGLHNAVAGKDGIIEVQLRDSTGFPRPNDGALSKPVVVVMKALDREMARYDHSLLSVLSDDNAGLYQFSYTIHFSQKYVVEAVIEGDVAGEDPVVVDVKPDVTNPDLCVVAEPVPAVLTSGVPINLIVETRDRYGNRRDDAGDQVDVYALRDESSSSYGKAINCTAIRKSADKGHYVMELEPRKSGYYTLFAAVNGKPVVNSPWRIRVRNNAPKPSLTQIDSSGLMDIYEAGIHSFGVSFFDHHMNPASACDGLAGGKCNVTAALSLDVPDSLASATQGGGTVSVTPIDSQGNSVVTLTTTKTGNYTLSIFLGGKHVKDSPTHFSTIPGPITSTESVVELYEDEDGIYRAGGTVKGRIRAMDEYMNGIHNGGSEFSSTVTIYHDSENMADSQQDSFMIEDMHDGTYSLSMMARRSGRHSAEVFLDNNILIKSMPLQFDVYDSGVTDTSKTSISGRALEKGSIHSRETVQLCLFDEFGNARSSDSVERDDGDTVSARLVQVVTVEDIDIDEPPNTSGHPSDQGAMGMGDIVLESTSMSVDTEDDESIDDEDADTSDGDADDGHGNPEDPDEGSGSIDDHDSSTDDHRDADSSDGSDDGSSDDPEDDDTMIDIDVSPLGLGCYDLSFVVEEAGSYSLEVLVNDNEVYRSESDHRVAMLSHASCEGSECHCDDDWTGEYCSVKDHRTSGAFSLLRTTLTVLAIAFCCCALSPGCIWASKQYKMSTRPGRSSQSQPYRVVGNQVEYDDDPNEAQQGVANVDRMTKGDEELEGTIYTL